MSSTPLPQPLLPSLGQILLSPFRQEGHSWKFVLAFALLATVGLVIMVPHGQDKVATIMATIWCVAMFGWLVMSILRQNHPFAARLVPGHVRRLKQVLVGAWAVTSLLGVAGLAYATGLNPWALALASGAACSFLALGMRWWPLWIVMWLAPMLMASPTLKGAWQSTLRSSIDAWQAQPELATLAGLALSAAVLPLIIGRGGDAHIRWYQRQTQMRELMRTGGGVKGLEQFGRLGEWMERPFLRVTNAWLQRTLRLAQPTPASTMSRLEIVLHGRQHWVRGLLGLGLAVVILGLMFGLVAALSGGNIDMQGTWKGGAAGLSFGLICIVLAPITAAVSSLWFTRREQALLALLPGVPQGSTLNRWVLWLHLRRVLWAFGPGLLCFWALAQAAERPSLFTMPFTSLPIVALLLLQAPARFHGGQAAMLLPGLAWMLSTGLGLGLVEMSGWVTVTELNLACVVLTALIAAWGYPRLLRAAPSLPAGRGRQAGADRHAHLLQEGPHAGGLAQIGVGQHPHRR